LKEKTNQENDKKNNNKKMTAIIDIKIKKNQMKNDEIEI
jgi:hypothetical protein